MNTPVSFELAKLLKEKGFKSESKAFYDGSGELFHYNHSNNEMQRFRYEAPTISEVVMWLYEKHGIWIGVICDVGNDLLFTFKIYSTKIGEEKCIVNGNMYESSTEAYEAAIIKYLVDNDCHIWDGDAYQAYIKRYNKGEYVGKTKLLENSKKNRTLTEPFTQEEFINKCKTDSEFSEKWGLKIEEREVLNQVDQTNPVLIGSTALYRSNDVQTKPTHKPMKTFKQYLESLKACPIAIEWAGDKPIEQVVTECHRGDWLLWLAKKCGVELQPLTLAKAHCANTVRHLMSDERSVKAVDVAIAFSEGRATRDELDAAASAAAAAADADTSAAYAAAAAADPYAAAAAADANQQQTADICRKYIGELIIEKVNQHLNQTNQCKDHQPFGIA